MSSIFWAKGQRAKFAEKMGVSQSYISDVLHRRKRVSPARAREMSKISEAIIGYPIPWEVFLFNQTSTHPALFGMPKYN